MLATSLSSAYKMPQHKQHQSKSPFQTWLSSNRRDRDITQEELEEKSGIDQGIISKYERGLLVPSKRENIVSLAKALAQPGASEHTSRILLNEGLRSAGFLPELEAELDPDLQMIVENWDGMTPTGRRHMKSAAELALEMSRENSTGKRAE